MVDVNVKYLNWINSCTGILGIFESCDVRLATKLCDIHYNQYIQCFEQRARHFICPTGHYCYLIQVDDNFFVETGRKCRKLYLVCRKVHSDC